MTDTSDDQRDDRMDPALKPLDPRELVFEAYRIEGITIWDCRTIFLDWALGFAVDTDTRPIVAQLLAHYGEAWPDHPMTEVLRAAMDEAANPKRRGGRAARIKD